MTTSKDERGSWHTPLSALSCERRLTIALFWAIFGALFVLTDSPPCYSAPSGDLKLFHLMSGAPRGLESLDGQSSGALTSRLKIAERWGSVKVNGHALLIAMGSNNNVSLLTVSPNLNGASEALPLSAQVLDEGAASAQVRADRLSLAYESGPLKVTVGRQAVSFGQGRLFTPLDRVSPFSPASVDREYKPGVDAIRLDGYWGVAGEWTIVGASRGSWDLDNAVVGVHIKDSFIGWDIGLIGLWVGGDIVGGGSASGSLGAFTIFGDLSITQRARMGALADADQRRKGQGAQLDSRFIRSTVGLDWRWTIAGGGGLTVELAWLGDGASTSQALRDAQQDLRTQRGERWLLGRSYSAISATQALTPLLNSSLTIISNIEDPSALIGPGLIWSVSDEASASVGAYWGAGEGVDTGGLQSELGALRWLTFVMISAYY